MGIGASDGDRTSAVKINPNWTDANGYVPWYWPPLLDPPSRLVRDQHCHVVDTRFHPGLVGTNQQYGVLPHHVRHLRDRAVSPEVAVARRYRSTYWVDEVRAYMVGRDKDGRPVPNRIEPPRVQEC
jgi:hypothetical protein